MSKRVTRRSMANESNALLSWLQQGKMPRSKSEEVTTSAATKSAADPSTPVTPKRGRGRPHRVPASAAAAVSSPRVPEKKKSPTSTSSSGKKAVPTKTTKRRCILTTDDEEDETDVQENDGDDDDDDEFKPDEASDDKIDETATSDNDDEEEDDDDDDVDEDESDEEFESKRKGRKPSGKVKQQPKQQQQQQQEHSQRAKRKSKKIDQSQQEEEQVVAALDTYDFEQKIDEWTYELDAETKTYMRPSVPVLAETAIAAFVSSKSRPKSTIYECPFCKRIFTYTLVFKLHLFSCSDNKNVPVYVLYCARRPQCAFSGKKKQEMINHYFACHATNAEMAASNRTVKSKRADGDDQNNDDSIIKLSKAKKGQLEVSRYFYTCADEFKFTWDYYSLVLAKTSHVPLRTLEEFFGAVASSMRPVEWSSDNEAAALCSELRFKCAGYVEFKLRPFETYSTTSTAKNDSFTVLNIGNQVTAMDWAFRPNARATSQYLAISVASPLQRAGLKIQHTFESPNLVHVYKFTDLKAAAAATRDTGYNNPHVQRFSLLDERIGHISCLKWRADFRCQTMANERFVGHLLATSSNGNGYIFRVEEPADCHSSRPQTVAYKPSRKILLSLVFSFGQCTSGDWCQLGAATNIALGYTNGSIALFSVDSRTLAANANDVACSRLSADDTMRIYPFRTFAAHLTFVNTIKWCKLNGGVLASGSLFSREVKLWDLRVPDKSLLEYEIFVTDMEFSLHSNDLFLTKEANLKGPNHLSALNLNFNVCNAEKDDSRAHPSIFVTNSTMTSVAQSDFVNKLLVCSNDGKVILARSNDTKFWSQKQKKKLINFSFAQICKFNVVNDVEEITKHAQQQTYNTNLEKRADTCTIEIELERVTSQKQKADAINQTNPIGIDMNSLTKICWNQNLGCTSWYACGSLSGFVFVHRIAELKESCEF